MNEKELQDKMEKLIAKIDPAAREQASKLLEMLQKAPQDIPQDLIVGLRIQKQELVDHPDAQHRKEWMRKAMLELCNARGLDAKGASTVALHILYAAYKCCEVSVMFSADPAEWIDGMVIDNSRGPGYEEEDQWVEARAREIYDSWRMMLGWVPWVEGPRTNERQDKAYEQAREEYHNGKRKTQ